MRLVPVTPLALCAALGAAPAQAFAPPLPPPVPIPPVREAQREFVSRIASYGPSPTVARCATRNVGVVKGAQFPPEHNVGLALRGSPPDAPTPNDRPTAVLSFSIDADGVPINIKPADDSMTSPDMVAAFARWRFMAGPPVGGCRIEVSRSYAPLTQASTATLLEVVARRRRDAPSSARRELSARGDCGKAPRRLPAQISYPDLRSFNDRDFAAPWAGVLYDIDAEGLVRNVRVGAQGGDPVLADLAAASVADSRFHPGRPVNGCYVTFAARPKASGAPLRASAGRPTSSSALPARSVKTEPPASNNACVAARETLNLSTETAYPPSLARERVEGWASLRFDVLPEGRVEAVQILAAQPVDAFGAAAATMLRRARPAPSAEGAKGCVIPISFAVKSVAED
ncbi:energy transducer TonB [Caulobacter endophyticus]|uniref:TonB C-terminal domain-containing protein n=1 Tax=Caulobacter endophyticus TaxID=2172652 RepID=A0A2T9JG01_9CAUL|nr:TonB family protein [Caulobacter endophyticus]PVM82596.1 hypothetical protein DDF67_23060 [Caulobacter endophyticus]